MRGIVDIPTLVPFGDAKDPIVHISAGIHNNLAVSAAGALYSWGQGTQGELGVGDETDAPTPQMIVRREGGLWKTVVAECGGPAFNGAAQEKGFQLIRNRNHLLLVARITTLFCTTLMFIAHPHHLS